MWGSKPPQPLAHQRCCCDHCANLLSTLLKFLSDYNLFNDTKKKCCITMIPFPTHSYPTKTTMGTSVVSAGGVNGETRDLDNCCMYSKRSRRRVANVMTLGDKSILDVR